MKIQQILLPPNEYSRPRKKIRELKALVMHWTANPTANAMQNRNFFAAKATGMSGYGSAHYIVGQGGEVVQCIPDDEIAYHCGSSRKDPVSGKIYTDWARQKFGEYYTSGCSSPNFCTLGIELCPLSADGEFSPATIDSAAELCAHLCRMHGLCANDITTHWAVVGWKDCPRWWVSRPGELGNFRAKVALLLCGGKENKEKGKGNEE